MPAAAKKAPAKVKMATPSPHRERPASPTPIAERQSADQDVPPHFKFVDAVINSVVSKEQRTSVRFALFVACKVAARINAGDRWWSQKEICERAASALLNNRRHSGVATAIAMTLAICEEAPDAELDRTYFRVLDCSTWTQVHLAVHKGLGEVHEADA